MNKSFSQAIHILENISKSSPVVEDPDLGSRRSEADRMKATYNPSKINVLDFTKEPSMEEEDKNKKLRHPNLPEFDPMKNKKIFTPPKDTKFPDEPPKNKLEITPLNQLKSLMGRFNRRT